jgi:Mitochondrial ATP synthase epsilon chain
VQTAARNGVGPMAQHWRVAGMTYLRYSNTCAELLRRVVKPSVQAEVKQAVPFSMTRAEWENGKIKKRSTLSRKECLRALEMLIALAYVRPGTNETILA